MHAPPLLVSFTSAENYLRACNFFEDHSEEQTILRLVEQGLPPVSSKSALAVLFGYSPRFVTAMCKAPRRFYRTFSIPKGNGKLRRIDAPRVALKVLQKWISYYISRAVSWHPSVFGFVPGRSAVEGAARHCGADWAFSSDIQDFFPSTSQELVRKALIRLGYSEKGAVVISELACIRGGLAQGSPCSPPLANLCFSDCDEKLVGYAKQHGLVYTRYADDVTFSGTGNPPADVQSFVTEAVRGEGWKISEEKTHLACLPKRIKVYGLIVSGPKPRLTKGYRNRLRRLAYGMEKGFFDPLSFQWMAAQGHLAYARSVAKFVDSPTS